jgi:hypothetical protein
MTWHASDQETILAKKGCDCKVAKVTLPGYTAEGLDVFFDVCAYLKAGHFEKCGFLLARVGEALN